MLSSVKLLPARNDTLVFGSHFLPLVFLVGVNVAAAAFAAVLGLRRLFVDALEQGHHLVVEAVQQEGKKFFGVLLSTLDHLKCVRGAQRVQQVVVDAGWLQNLPLKIETAYNSQAHSWRDI